MRTDAPSQSSSERQIKLFGFRLDPLTGEEVVDRVGTAIASRQRLIMANLNVHGMAAMYDSPAMATLLAQPDVMVMVDSMPLIAVAALKGYPVTRAMRATSLDFYDDMFGRAVKEGWRIAYVGADSQTLSAGIDLLKTRFPGLQIEGRDGYFDMEDFTPGSAQMEIIDWLRNWSPDLVIVGMGMPRQEKWIERAQHMVDARVFMPTGAYLDFQVGTQKPAPRWMGQAGIEWAYRLALSPRRLSYRYLVEPLVLLKFLLTRPHPQRKVTNKSA